MEPTKPSSHSPQPSSYHSPGMKGESDDTKTVSHEALQHTVGNTEIFRSSQKPRGWDIADKENYRNIDYVGQQVLRRLGG